MNEKRLKFYLYFFSGFFIFIILNLFKLQIIEGNYWSEKSSRTRIQISVIEPARGNIYDATGNVLAHNRAGYTIIINPSYIKKYPGLTQRLSYYLGVEPEELLRKIDLNSTRLQKIARDVDINIVSKLEENREDLPGIQIVAEPVRVYSLGKYAAHIIGYLGEVSPTELEQKDSTLYSSGDLIGKMGIERVYDIYLKGMNGYVYNEIDVSGRLIRPFIERPTIPSERGADIYLTINSDLQQHLHSYLWYPACAGIVMNVKTGAILAMVSKPDFPPDSLSFALKFALWESLINNSLHPLMNRCIGSNYPPASTLKPFTTLIARKLEVDTGKYEPCEGNIDLQDGLPHKCHGGPHGKISLYEAVYKSCDIYFYQLALRIGFNRFIEMIKIFGFGEKTNIDLYPESSGLVPDSLWYDDHYGEDNWPKGVVVNLAIGQGEFLATPIQIVAAFASIANNGYKIKPYLCDSIVSIDNEILYRVEVEKTILPVSRENISFIQEALKEVVDNEDGTANLIFTNGLPIAGKTGTAENIREDHSWFVAYAPYDDPEIVVGIFIENAGAPGGKVAAPITKLVFEYYFTFISPYQPYIDANKEPEEEIYTPIQYFEEDSTLNTTSDTTDIIIYDSINIEELYINPDSIQF